MESAFGEVTVFLAADINELNQPIFEWGTIEEGPGGVRQQTDRGVPDSSEFDRENSRISARLAADRINQFTGFEIVGTTSTGTNASSWQKIGTSVTGGLLLRTDSANGPSFTVGEGCDVGG